MTQADLHPQFEMIRFDKRVKIYIGICSILFVLFVAFKIHNSSLANWNYNLSDGGSEKRGVIVGTPLAIRSDEWLVFSPFVISQEKKGFPTSNEALGYGKTPLAMGLPTKSILSVVKPALWGYYFLDTERAFSWHWNFKVFPFLIAMFLFLLLFTNNNFNVSLFGSIWLYLCSSIQWWSINTEIFTWGIATVVSFLYIIYSNKPKQILISGVIFALSAYSFAFVLYPAYQVPLAYFLLALIIAFLVSRKNFNLLLNKKWIKLATLAVSGIFLLSLFYVFYNECKDTIHRMTETVYPGARDEGGGNFPFLLMFRDNFSWWYNQDKFPPNWGNICELSSWLILSPIASIMLIYSWIKTKKINYYFVPLIVFHLMAYVWMFYGFPHWLARITLFSNSQAARTFFIYGFSNVVFTILYLSQFKKTAETSRLRPSMAVVGVVIFLVSLAINYSLHKQSERWFSKQQFINASLIYAALNWLIVYFSEKRMFQYLFYAVCLGFVASNIFINPISKGLDPIYDNKFYKIVNDINDKDPGKTWMVFGSLVVPDFLKAAGTNCINGVQFAPPLEKMRVLDPTLQKKDVYNRYAHILALPFIDGRDSVDFYLNSPDLYSIKMDPSSPRLKQMNIKYLFFTYKPSDAEVRNLVPVTDAYGCFIYKQKDL